MSNHLRIVAFLSPRIGRQGKSISMISMFSIVSSEDLWRGKGHLLGQKKRVTPCRCFWDLLASRKVTPWKYRFSMFCTCYFVALMTCFPIGLMSLSSVRRAASDFKPISFHSSRPWNQFLQPPRWVILT